MVTSTSGLLWTIKKQSMLLLCNQSEYLLSRYNKKLKCHKTHNAYIFMTVTFSPCKRTAWSQKKGKKFVVEEHHVEGIAGCISFHDGVGTISPFQKMKIQGKCKCCALPRVGLGSFLLVPSWPSYLLVMCTFLCSLYS